MKLNKDSFNLLVFLGLGIQYALMHLFSSGQPLAVTSIELVLYIMYTAAGLTGFFLKSRRVPGESVSGLPSLFFSVLWTVSITSHFRKESYSDSLTMINSLGVSTAFLVLLAEFIILCKA